MNSSISGRQRDAAASINLWLVDDHEEFRERLGRLLKRFFGFEHIQHFESAEAAFEGLGRLRIPDVVLLDTKLPGMNGAAAVRVIKAKAPTTRVILFSAFFDVARAKEALEGGASAVLTKSQPYEDVVAAICAELAAESCLWHIESA